MPKSPERGTRSETARRYGWRINPNTELLMKKTILTFGFIAGAILAATMLATVPFMEKIGDRSAMLIGYTSMVLAFLLVYFGVRSYRENLGGGAITFGRALRVGISIAAIG